MNKKFLKFLTSLFIVSLSSCSNNQISSTIPPHTHEFNDGDLVIDNENYLEKMVYECECGEISEEITHQHTFEESYSYDALNHYNAPTCGHNIKKDSESHTYDEMGNCEKCDYVNQKKYEEYLLYNTPVDIEEQYPWLSILNKDNIQEVQIKYQNQNQLTNTTYHYTSNKESIGKLFDAVIDCKLYPISKDKQGSILEVGDTIKINFVTENKGYTAVLCNEENVILRKGIYYSSDFKYELDETYSKGTNFDYDLERSSIYANDLYKGVINSNIYNFIICKKISNDITYYNNNNLLINVDEDRSVSIIDSTHISINKSGIYEIVGSVNFKDLYDKYYVENESVTLTIVDAIHNENIAEIIYTKGATIEKIGIKTFDFIINYEELFTNRYLYEDELLTNKLTSLTMDADKTVYLGFIEIDNVKLKNLSVENCEIKHFIKTYSEDWYTTYTYYTLGSGSIIPNGTLLTSYEDLLNTKFEYAAGKVFKEEIFQNHNIMVIFRTAPASNSIAMLYKNIVIDDDIITLDYINPKKYSFGLTAVYDCHDFILIPKDVTYNIEDISMIYINDLLNP